MPAPEPDDDALRRAGDRVARLLEELGELTTPPAWQRVEQLVQTLVDLYGAGLVRLWGHLDAAGAPAPLRRRIVEDELVSSLLVLHGFHPDPPAARIARALEAEAAQLGAVRLLSLDGDVARLRVEGPARAPLPVLARALERLVRDVAPEVARVELDGLAARRAEAPGLVQIDLQRSRAGKTP